MSAMSATTSRALARTLFAAWLIIAAAALLLAYLNRPITSDLSSLDSVDLAYVAGSVVFTFVFAVVGTLVASRTAHPIGWLLTAVAISWMLPLLFEQYGARGLAVSPGSLPAARLALSTGSLTIAIVFAPLALILLLFPTGTVRSPRWRPLLFAVPAATLLVAIPLALWPGWSEWGLEIDNPVGLQEEAKGLLEAAITIGVLLMVGLLLAGVLSLVLRFRASRGTERQQIKYLALVALAEAMIFVGTVIVSRVTAGTEAEDAASSISWGVLVCALMFGMPVAIGVAILRYRLYDIDRIFNRTLVYGLLTAGLALTYFGLVVGLQAALRPVSGGSDFAIALTTLVVAALFFPARLRVQNAVDRRFNRRAYDAARTIEAFSARLREQIDLDTLRYELLAMVDETMQPAAASLWLRGPEARR
jgi:hypothetical protein